jgi:hypothetical protein
MLLTAKEVNAARRQSAGSLNMTAERATAAPDPLIWTTGCSLSLVNGRAPIWTICARIMSCHPPRALRLAAELKDFRNARASDDLRIVRSELVAGGMLAAAGVGFDFGARGGRPSLISSSAKPASGIEIRNWTLDGLRELEASRSRRR